tara:strand:+ start:245 stop:559 length:315 start_codon:yes stop_codon:yes gene_type:complete
MVYVRPTSKKSTSGGPVASSDSDYLAVDHDHIAENSPLVATKAGFGIKYRVVGDSDGADNAVFNIEILDAMPMAKSSVQTATSYDSDTDALTEDVHEYKAFNSY